MRRPRRGDAGQAFPIYITVVAGLLFLAFAYLAVGQAAANRNGAQTAADAAALAAALDTRDKLTDEWVENVLDPTKWQDIFDGKDVVLDGCGRAGQLAAQNDATAVCEPLYALPPGYKVEAKTTKPVGDSIVPGTEDRHSTAKATAVIERRCEFKLPGGDTEGDEGAEGAEGDVLPQLTCEDDKTWDVDPDDPTTLPGPEDLFDVHLAD
ncbi:pilus assembly protein TadG-related protein [Streptomyces sp. NPDC059010]|uniref:pilus assembly protein TadG-related protein n=1 Tax=Streptomyces sp. NPDC059010 TaxID=3346695 RepID=UPI0036AAC27E